MKTPRKRKPCVGTVPFDTLSDVRKTPSASPRVVVGYVRVSTARQATEGVSLEAQESRIRAYAVAQGLEVASVHVDEGLSGGRANNRPALQAALTDACKRRGVLVVYSLSRLARSTKDALEIGARLDKAGADLVSLSESLDTTSASGKMIFRLLAVLAEFERDLISERTTGAMAHLRLAGRRISHVIPYGYTDEGGKLVPVPAERAVVRRMLAWQEAGLSLRAIAAKLAEAGIPSKMGRPTWTAATVRHVLLRAVKLTEAA